MADRRRSGVVIIERGRVMLIERWRAGMHYFVCPGGGVEPGESYEDAARREALEELGVEVELDSICLDLEFFGRQVYFLARIVSGTMREADFSEPKPDSGRYRPTWVALADLERLDVRPPELTEWTRRHAQRGDWSFGER